MDLKAIAASLSEIEKKALKAIGSEESFSFEEIAGKSGLQIDSVRRAMGWLAEKKLVEISEEKKFEKRLTEKGKIYLEKGMPEEVFLDCLEKIGGTSDFEELQKKTFLPKEEFGFALGFNRKKNFVVILKGEKPRIQLTGLSKELPPESGKELLEKIEEKKLLEREKFLELRERGIVEEIEKTARKARINEQGKKALEAIGSAKERAYNIQGAVPEIFIGKKQPYVRFLQGIRRKLTELGFVEMDSPAIVQEFYNFDVLFQPQNHPARQWADTYQLKQPKFGALPPEKIVEKIKAAHENGAGTGSRGWQYKWDIEIAKKLMPAAHATAHSARQLVKGVKVPGKYFSISRCYRPDIVDAKHLIEFNQMDGIIIDEQMNFRKLLGMLRQFAVEFAGTEKIKFVPSYYPFTEPSCQLNVKHPELGWIELGGSGIFRPELTLPLGIKQPVLAWGLGIDRLAMVKLGIKDIRQLFSDDLNWLRKQPMAAIE
ncbi:MAG: phenylalanine--tRNA ligase subunit alpha [Candidatus ainarchaeum sp.]|nr:phenylalanine--tRNA ligase subunit alpha [Candidatus ainarchaeum sp.]